MGIIKFFKKPFKSSTQLSKAEDVDVRKAQQESLEKLNNAFCQLVDKLENINGNLNRHIDQQQELLKRFETIPEITQQQTELIEQTLEQLSEQSVSTGKFTEIVSRIPDEALRQTRELEQIKAQGAESAEFEKNICQEFIKLNLAVKRQSAVLVILGFAAAAIIVVFAAMALFSS